MIRLATVDANNFVGGVGTASIQAIVALIRVVLRQEKVICARKSAVTAFIRHMGKAVVKNAHLLAGVVSALAIA